MSLEQEVKESGYLLELLKTTTQEATLRTVCKRKAAGASAIQVRDGRLQFAEFSFNGPARPGFVCSGIQGGCGCIHSEPRLVMKSLRHGWQKNLILVCTYSPCETCANTIIESELFMGCIYEVLTTYPNKTDRGVEFLSSVMPVITAEELRALMSAPLKETRVHDELRRWRSARSVRR